MDKRVSGFTIVELLIVIVVIGILAAITLVAYNGVQQRALNTARISEVDAWQKQFMLYYAATGGNPAVASGNYCLGTGFPNGACRNYKETGSNTYYESNNATLMSLMQQENGGSLPSGPREPVNNAYIGPFVNIWPDDTGFSIFQFFTGKSTDCPLPMTYLWDDGNNSIMCQLNVQFS